MALSTTSTYVEYDGNGSTVTAYPIPFQFSELGHITVRVKTGGVWDDLDASDFTVTRAEDGTGSLVTVEAIADTSLVRISRVTPSLQPTVLAKSSVDPFARSIETALDRLAMRSQEDAAAVAAQLNGVTFSVSDGKLFVTSGGSTKFVRLNDIP